MKLKRLNLKGISDPRKFIEERSDPKILSDRTHQLSRCFSLKIARDEVSDSLHKALVTESFYAPKIVKASHIIQVDPTNAFKKRSKTIKEPSTVIINNRYISKNFLLDKLE